MLQLHSDDVLRRLKRLEEAVFNEPSRSAVPPPVSANESTLQYPSEGFTAFGLHLVTKKPDQAAEQRVYMTSLINKLPPPAQARVLLDHFAKTSHPNTCIQHIPSCRYWLQRTYDTVIAGGMPPMEGLLLLFSIFAAAAFLWSSEFLQAFHATRAEAKAAFVEYFQAGMSIIDNAAHPIMPSTTALAAMCNLHYVTTHARGLSDSDMALRIKCYGMARSLQIDRLDTAKSQQERRQGGCNMIEVETQRKIWWSLVCTDWLNAFSGGPNDGAYFHQPKHMNVRLPANIDDKDLTADMTEEDIPLTQPSDMSGFICRVKLSQLCREVVDALPSRFLDVNRTNYETVLQMDREFRTFLDGLPVYFRLDPESMERSKAICRERPIIALHRVGINFSIQVRLCRLHRPYHLEGQTNPTYQYSQGACIRAAQIVLDLRRVRDECGWPLGMNPSRSWIVVQHVSIAALILATDVSFNPKARGSENLKTKVLATCELLEKSMEDFESFVEGFQRNVQVLRSTLRQQPSRASSAGAADMSVGFPNEASEDQTDWMSSGRTSSQWHRN
ncbi:C6 zinc finger domain protein [Metarhizium album ARSEF 1941]|uniref:C6 zinc finger domain protein n=1 Tax=Metarhizium album (strain ARSEF 1941) TaxID=1081103 RepID=A0A0B2WPL1_METAS|nr:C6 zinc finger domain protein [Metarhizium album ARSEF 1941]KHN97981.1 C6 zinc finger domain protein [Metarhizium album ARSEF 1941]